MKDTELLEAALGQPSLSAEALPSADEKRHPAIAANIRRSFGPKTS